MFGLDTSLTILLLICIFAAMAFEFINGFHDTANAVATVIYTNTLKPLTAVVWSGIWNFIGVFAGGIAVAMGIVNLLPTEVLVDNNIWHAVSMILALILTAIAWNLWTWYYGIPCSSSHTLLGSIFGVGIAYLLLPDSTAVALNWGKVQDVGLSLLISPIMGFAVAMGLMQLLVNLVKNKVIFQEPEPGVPPPFWIRSILVLTCTSVSFFHGSNDGQKGVGLMMIILIGIVPAWFAVDHMKSPVELTSQVSRVEQIFDRIDLNRLTPEDVKNYELASAKLADLKQITDGKTEFALIADSNQFAMRKDILLIAKKIDEILARHIDKPLLNLTKDEQKELKSAVKGLKEYTEYAPFWVLLLISLSLGLGTMVGWKRIVVTIGEKIGNKHLTYAQGASAELVAASTIGLSTAFGLPVSTTHVLSSGIAGTMVASDGFKNLQYGTVKNILIAWLVTLPVTMIVSGLLFFFLRLILV
ncbi:MAG: inorganic phosphate transporter [Bacteroidetes bacterium]|nr:inorganic phosphate transporter [Bacteroidota bacterium]